MSIDLRQAPLLRRAWRLGLKLPRLQIPLSVPELVRSHLEELELPDALDEP